MILHIGIVGDKLKEKLKHLFNELYIGNDAYNIIIYERSINTKGINIGMEKFTPISFHSNLASAKHSLMREYTIANISNLDIDNYFEFLDVVIDSLDKVRNDKDYRNKNRR